MEAAAVLRKPLHVVKCPFCRFVNMAQKHVVFALKFRVSVLKELISLVALVYDQVSQSADQTRSQLQVLI